MHTGQTRPFLVVDKAQSQEDTCSISSGYVSDSAESWSCASNVDGFYSSQTSSTSSPSSSSSISGSLQLSNSTQSGFRNNTERLASWLDGQESDSDRSVPSVTILQRQHPRRTSQAGNSAGRTLPCSLTRQDERSEGFVALLVAFTAGLVECIWPLSACPPRVDPKFYGGGVLPLKTFIQETLRRSKTSYSTLQVALFYLIVLKDHLPSGDFTQEQSRDNDCRAMQCGRRMFLSALILASKYLQDRNYSTRAWSKISGLRTTEINQNEIKYLQAIGWKLHLSKETFDRWSRIVLRLSAAPPKDCGVLSGNLAQIIGWKELIQRLTPDLPEDFSEYETGLLTPPVSPPSDAFEQSDREAEPASPTDRQKAPTSCTPTTAEPTPRPNNAPLPTLPPMPRLHNLPTPQTTPCSGFSATPCVALKPYPRCSASYAAMSNVRRDCLARATLDRCPPPQPQMGDQTYGCQPQYNHLTRRSSLSSSVAFLASSPESMVSDHSSVSARSRSSSISSVTSASCVAPQNLRIDKLSTRRFPAPGSSRSIRSMPSMDGLLNAVSRSHIPPIDETASEAYPSPGFYGTNPEAYYTTGSVCSAVANESEYKNIVAQSLPTHDNSLMELEAAAALCNLRPLSRPSTAIPTRVTPLATPKASQRGPVLNGPSKSHKRSHSKVNDALQDQVRKNLLSANDDVNMVIADDYPSHALDASVSPMFKASQSPSRSWASLKTPVPVRGTENSKRWCATESRNPAVDYAARLLRPDLQQIWG